MERMTDHFEARRTAQYLRGSRLRTSTEIALQASIGEALTAGAIAFEREKSLGPRDRPDFLLYGGRVVLEAKTRQPKKAIYRQITRYAQHEQVEAIILVTGTATGMPEEIDGKPVYVVSAGAGMLGC
jgi:hypothetical protein